MKFIQIENEEDKTELCAVIVQGHLQPQLEAESAALEQLCSAECLEIHIWCWTISSVKHVPGCNPLYLISVVYCQQSLIFSFVEYNRHTVLSLLLISCLLLKSHFLGHPFLGIVVKSIIC